MSDLSIPKKSQRLRIYIGESDHWRGKALYDALLETLKENGLAGATVLRGVAGFGAKSRIHTASILRLSEDLPLVIDVVDTPEKIAQALELIYPMVQEGLITLEDVQVVKYTHRYHNPLPADRPISEVMTRDFQFLTPDQPIHTAWEKMLKNRIKVFPVLDPSGKAVGILTDEDLLERVGIQQRLAIAARLDPSLVAEELRQLQRSSVKVGEVMSQPVITAREDEPLGLVAARMVKSGLKRLPVTGASGQVVGMLSRLDILRQVTDGHQTPPSPQTNPPAGHLVSEIMSADVPRVSVDDTLANLIEIFTSSGIHRLIVTDSEGKAVGLISDSDVIARIQPARQRSILDAFRKKTAPPFANEKAVDLMSVGPLMAAPDLPIVEAARLMLAEGRKWLVVAGPDQKPLGLVDRQILFEAIAAGYRPVDKG